jgi:hypothetical protein
MEVSWLSRGNVLMTAIQQNEEIVIFCSKENHH